MGCWQPDPFNLFHLNVRGVSCVKQPQNSISASSENISSPIKAILFFIAAFFPVFFFFVFLNQQVFAEDINIVFSQEPKGVDPHKHDSPAARMIIFNCYQRLVELKSDSSEVKPSIALTWRVSDDGRIYTFILKNDLFFADGMPLNADAVKFSFLRLLKLKELKEKYFPNLAGVMVIGPHTIRFILKEPDPSFPTALASSAGSIVSPGVFDRPHDYLDAKTLGSGMFYLADWTSGRKIVIKPRSDAGIKSAYDSFNLIFGKSQEEQWDTLIQQDADIAFDLDSSYSSLLKMLPDVSESESVTFSYALLFFNIERNWLDTRENRQALAMSLNIESLIEAVIDGGGVRIKGVLPSGLWGVNPNIRHYDYDLEKAQSIIKKNGIPDRNLLMLVDPGLRDGQKIAEYIIGEYSALGLNIKSVHPDADSFRTYLNNTDYDLALTYAAPPVPEAGRILMSRIFSKGVDNLSGYKNADVDSQLIRTLEVQDKNRRKSLYYSLQETVAEDVPFFTLFQMKKIIGYSNELESIQLNAAAPEMIQFNSIRPRPPEKPAAAEPVEEKEIVIPEWEIETAPEEDDTGNGPQPPDSVIPEEYQGVKTSL